jgi:hypothetical protein
MAKSIGWVTKIASPLPVLRRSLAVILMGLTTLKHAALAVIYRPPQSVSMAYRATLCFSALMEGLRSLVYAKCQGATSRCGCVCGLQRSKRAKLGLSTVCFWVSEEHGGDVRTHHQSWNRARALHIGQASESKCGEEQDVQDPPWDKLHTTLFSKVTPTGAPWLLSWGVRQDECQAQRRPYQSRGALTTDRRQVDYS